MATEEWDEHSWPPESSQLPFSSGEQTGDKWPLLSERGLLRPAAMCRGQKHTPRPCNPGPALKLPAAETWLLGWRAGAHLRAAQTSPSKARSSLGLGVSPDGQPVTEVVAHRPWSRDPSLFLHIHGQQLGLPRGFNNPRRLCGPHKHCGCP